MYSYCVNCIVVQIQIKLYPKVSWIMLILDTAKPVSKLLSFIYLLRLRTTMVQNSNFKVEM